MVGEQQEAAQRTPVGRRGRFLPWMIFLLGLCLSFVAYHLVRDWEEAIIRADFELLSRTHAASLHRELYRHLDGSTSLVGLFDASQEVERGEFHLFVKRLLSQHSDIHSIMWIPKVTAAELPGLLAKAQRDGLEDFRIIDHDPSGRLIPAPARKEYFPIYYLEPAMDTGLLGLDVSSIPPYRAALEETWDSGDAVMSPPIQIGTQGAAIWLARAVYDKEAGLATAEQRWSALNGLIIESVLLADFVDEALEESAPLGLNTQIVYHDDSGNTQLVHERALGNTRARQPLEMGGELGEQLVWRGRLHASNPRWEVVLSPAPQFWQSHPVWRSWTVSAVGVVLSFLLWLYMFVLARQTSRAESLAYNLSRSNAKLQDEIRKRTRIEERAVKLSRAIEQAADSVMITDRNGIIEYVNPAFESMTGFTPEETIGRKSNLVRSGRHDAEFYKRLWETITGGAVFQDVLINRKKNGSLYYEEKTITPLKDATGNITHFIGTGKDITDRMQTQERLHHLAYHDVLTELPNRLLFLERLTHALKAWQGQHRRLAVMLLDLDRFKVINDTLGPQVGDNLLRKIAAALPACASSGDTVARLGGDEFGILIEDMVMPDAVAALARRVLSVFSEPFYVDGHEFYVNTSIGISIYPEDGADADTLLKNADVALYRAKEQGGNTYQYYSPDMSAKAVERLSLDTSLRRALERNEFCLYFQPQIDLASGGVVALEVLLRWQHPELGLMQPLDFIPLLEETGLIVPVGAWVTEQACKHAVPWQQYGPLRIAVNFSGRQFRNAGFGGQIMRILQESRLPPGLLEVEITESVLMQGDKISSGNIAVLHEAGVRFALDDFGTGYSSLSYLKRFPIKTLKIDRAFVRDVKTNQDDAAIVTAIIAMARSLELDVVAEGVEADEQLQFLRAAGCDMVQGYMISHPLPVFEVEGFLARGRRTAKKAWDDARRH